MAELFEHLGLTEELGQIGPLQDNRQRRESSIMADQNIESIGSITGSFATTRPRRVRQAEERKLVRLREREERNVEKLRKREERDLARLRERELKQALRNQQDEQRRRDRQARDESAA